jgi:hypothetical protein
MWNIFKRILKGKTEQRKMGGDWKGEGNLPSLIF